MSTLTLEEAQAHLAELIGRLAPGEEVTLTRDDRPVAPLPDAPTDDIPEYLRQFIPPPGTVMPYWKPALTPDGWEQVQQLLAEIEGKR